MRVEGERGSKKNSREDSKRKAQRGLEVWLIEGWGLEEEATYMYNTGSFH